MGFLAGVPYYVLDSYESVVVADNKNNIKISKVLI